MKGGVYRMLTEDLNLIFIVAIIIVFFADKI